MVKITKAEDIQKLYNNLRDDDLIEIQAIGSTP